MLVVFVLFFLLPLNQASLSYEHPNPDGTYFQKCVSGIIKKYFKRYKELSIVNMNTEYEDIAKIINRVNLNTVILQNAHTRLGIAHDGYIIVAGNYTDFIDNLPDLAKKIYWQPSARFLIIVNDLNDIGLRQIFDLLLKYHVNNVVAMDKSADPNLYTYNPFENYGCGQRYDRIIEYGKCSTTHKHNMYPYKLVTGLRNCTLKVASPHWPPYSIDPAKNEDYGLLGVEVKVLIEMGKLENFEVEFSYSDDGEEFSTIKNDVEAVGPMYLLQNRQVQMMAGGLILTHSRAVAFDYIWAHLAYTEEISYQVQRAKVVATWKYMYLEFDALVWTVLILAFLVFLLIFVVLVRPRDRGRIVLVMIGYLLLAGSKIRGNFFTRYLFIHWVLFAYIINVYYVTNLMSFTTNPVRNYQVSSEEDILENNMQPCVSSVIKGYLASVGLNESIWQSNREGCDKLMESIKMVSESKELYTLVIRSLYRFNKFGYRDEWGGSTIYTVSKPLTKIIYAIYLYKGFPMLDKLHMQALRMREYGLVEEHFKYLYWQRSKKYHFNTKKKRYNVVVPWYLLLFGYLLSAIVFLLEITVKKFLMGFPILQIII